MGPLNIQVTSLKGEQLGSASKVLNGSKDISVTVHPTRDNLTMPAKVLHIFIYNDISRKNLTHTLTLAGTVHVCSHKAFTCILHACYMHVTCMYERKMDRVG